MKVQRKDGTIQTKEMSGKQGQQNEETDGIPSLKSPSLCCVDSAVYEARESRGAGPTESEHRVLFLDGVKILGKLSF
jgi:hypothetical protein